MYPSPGDVRLGVPWEIQAFAHSIAILSMQFGSFDGVVGSSGRHVQSFVPLRSTGISPPSVTGQSMTVAFFEIFGGAALIAFWIFQEADRAAPFFTDTVVSVLSVLVA